MTSVAAQTRSLNRTAKVTRSAIRFRCGRRLSGPGYSSVLGLVRPVHRVRYVRHATADAETLHHSWDGNRCAPHFDNIRERTQHGRLSRSRTFGKLQATNILCRKLCRLDDRILRECTHLFLIGLYLPTYVLLYYVPIRIHIRVHHSCAK